MDAPTRGRRTSDSRATHRATVRRPRTVWPRRRRRGSQPYPETPVDPWIGVVDGKPAITGGRIRPRPEAECSALHDHCLRECAWFPVQHASKLARQPATTVPAIRVDDPDVNFDAADGGILGTRYPTYYRTVPATRRMLTPGAIIVVVDYPYWAPTGEALEGGVLWKMGVLDRVDWNAGKLYLAGETGAFWLSAARVAVLSYQAGGTVEILGGRNRDELAVKPDEVLPRHPRSH